MSTSTTNANGKLHPGDYWWQTYDGKNTQMAGEPYMSAERAQADALWWANQHVRAR